MSATAMTAKPAGESAGSEPANAKLVLVTLIIIAAVANLPLAMANVALPSIGAAFDAIADPAQPGGGGLLTGPGLLGAMVWRPGRPLRAQANCHPGRGPGDTRCADLRLCPNDRGVDRRAPVRRFCRWHGLPDHVGFDRRTMGARPGADSLDRPVGSVRRRHQRLGPLLSGLLLTTFPWNSIFFVVLPVAVIALLMALKYLPSHVNESTELVDNLGGILSLVLVGSFILAINFAPVASDRNLVIALLTTAIISLIFFVIRQRRAENPLYDLKVAARPTFWVAAVGGIIVFGSLMGAMFIGQQFLQDVLGYSTVNAGLAILPAAIFMVLVAPRSAKLVEERGARFVLLAGYFFVLLGFITMLLLWNEGIPYWMVGLGYPSWALAWVWRARQPRAR